MKSLREFLQQHPMGRWGLALTLLVIFVGITAPWIAPANPISQDLALRLEGPTLRHWMGTDELGRDILSRIIYGGRVSVIVSISVVVGEERSDWRSERSPATLEGGSTGL